MQAHRGYEHEVWCVYVLFDSNVTVKMINEIKSKLKYILYLVINWYAMNKSLIEQINNWNDNRKYSKVIETVEKLPQSEWSYDIKGILARAYINTRKCDKAIDLLLSEKITGSNDALWNYRIGFAYYNNKDYKNALQYFQRCTELGDIGDKQIDYLIKECIQEIPKREDWEKTRNSITAYNLSGKSEFDGDFSYVTIRVTWKGKEYVEIPTQCQKTQVMRSHDSVYGVVGSKVGDFIGHYGENSSKQEGVFTHRHIAELLTKRFTGLKFNELIWLENPLEKKLSTGKPRIKKAKWLPEKEVDLVHLYSDEYIDINNQTTIKTDFFNVIRMEEIKKKKCRSTWFMCTKETAQEINNMNFSCLYIKKSTIWGGQKDEHN